MTRIIKAGPRPFLSLGITLAITMCLLIAAALTGAGKLSEIIKGADLLLAVYAAIFISIFRTRIVVVDQSIILRSAFGLAREVRFRDISRSVAEVLAEPDHPIALHIFSENERRPFMSLRLKSYRQEDISWLLNQPGLRVVRR